MRKDQEHKPISVEDLLRLKKAEQPRRDFWSAWQREMNSKLDAAAQDRPSWVSRSLPRLWIAIARWQMPVGACALLALGFIAVREYNPALPAASVPASLASNGSTIGAENPVQASSSLLSELRDAEAAAGRSTPRPQGLTSSLAMIDSHAGSTTQEVAWPARQNAVGVDRTGTLVSEFSGVSYTLHGRSPLPATEEPLARVNATRDARRERLLGMYQSATWASQGTVRSQNLTPSRLSEDQLTENIVRRLQARGDKLSVRF